MKTLKGIIPGLFMLLFGFVAVAMTTNDVVPEQQEETIAEVTLEGTVVDGATGEALSGVEVQIAELEATAETDENGAFTVDGLTDGETYTITIEHEGYEAYEQTVEATAMGAPSIEVSIELTPSE